MPVPDPPAAAPPAGDALLRERYREADLVKLSILVNADPVDALASLIAAHVPVTQISPYQTGAGLHKPGLFFGRNTLLAQIVGREPANYLVVGGRQVGKSSLLKQVERLCRSRPDTNCHYLTLSDEAGMEAVAAVLGMPGASLPDVLAHLDRKSVV